MSPPLTKRPSSQILVTFTALLRLSKSKVISGGVEFGKCKVFMTAINYHKVRFQTRLTRRHKKVGRAENKHTILRQISQHLYQEASDARFYSLITSEILNRATYIANVLYGVKLLSVFEMVGGYTLSISGLPSWPVSSQLREAHICQPDSCILRRVIHDIPDQRLSRHLLAKDQKVYYFLCSVKFGSLKSSIVGGTTDSFLEITHDSAHKGAPIRAAYEYIRIAPSNPLLDSLKSLGLCFPRYYSILTSEMDDFELEDKLGHEIAVFPAPSTSSN